MTNKILLALSFPALICSWLFAIIGIYFLGSNIFEYTTTEENTSLAAIWAFMFSFGSASIAGVIASKAKFFSISYIRKIYLYSIAVSAILFLGHLIIGTIIGLLGS